MLPGLTISVLLLVLLFSIVDWQDVYEVLRKAEWRYILLALPVYAVGYWLRSLAWYNLLKEEVPIKRVFFVMQSGYLLNNIFPFRLGEVGRMVLLGKDLGFFRVMSTILIERAFDMLIAAATLLGTLPFVLSVQDERTQIVALLVAFLVLGGLIVLRLLAGHPSWIKRIAKIILGRWQALYVSVLEKVDSFTEGLVALTDWRRFAAVAAWMILSWLVAFVVQFLFMRSVIQNPGFIWAVFVLSFSALGVAVPSSPAYIGVYEGAMTLGLTFFGVPAEQGLAYALISHIAYIFLTGILGAVGLIGEGETLAGLYSRIQKQNTLQKEQE